MIYETAIQLHVNTTVKVVIDILTFSMKKKDSVTLLILFRRDGGFFALLHFACSGIYLTHLLAVLLDFVLFVP